MKDLDLYQAKVLAAAVQVSKSETKKQLLELKEQIDNVKFVRGPAGPAGPKGDTNPVIVGATGLQGEKGESGEAGNSLTEAGIFEDNLILGFTDGEKLDVGKVVGPRGGQGKQGVIGEEGPIGVKGSRGELGPIGPQGVKGDKGDKGDIGNTGDTGPIGLQGNAGVKGDQGERGQTGQPGTTGTAGTPGGPVGPIGPRGEEGPEGPEGPVGPEGPKGTDGRFVDLKPLQTELEGNLKSFKDSISSQVTRLALSGGGGSSGGGEVLLHRLDDVDYNTTQSPTNGQILLYNTTKGKWEANTTIATTLTTRSIIPSANITYDIGTPALRYRDIYLSGGTIHVAGATLSANSTGWQASVGGGATSPVETTSSVSGTYVANTAFQAVLANTNAYIASMSTDVQLANTNTYIATKVNTSTFNSALANTNTYIATKTTTTTNFSTANLTSTAGFITTAGANPRVTINATSGNPGLNFLEDDANGIILYYNTSANQFVIGQNGTADWFKMDDGTGLVTLQGSAVVQQGMPVRQAGGNNVTLALGDNGKLIWCVNTASAMNIHIPNNSSVAFPIGAEMTFLQKLTHASANTLGFSAAAGVTLDSKEAANTVADRNTAATLKKLATNTWILIGNLS